MKLKGARTEPKIDGERQTTDARRTWARNPSRSLFKALAELRLNKMVEQERRRQGEKGRVDVRVCEREIESERGERSPRSRNVGRELKNKHIKEKKK
jgi:hypothetical protein